MKDGRAQSCEVGAIPTSADRDATNVFVRAHIGWMLRLARNYLREQALAEDAVQNAFAQVFTKSAQFQGRASIEAWMRRIVVNEALMILRKRKSVQEDGAIDLLLPEFDENACRLETPESAECNPEQILILGETREIVQAAIARLPDTYRVVLLLRDIEEFTTAEVAEKLNISETNVKVRLHRARAALKRLLEFSIPDGETKV